MHILCTEASIPYLDGPLLLTAAASCIYVYNIAGLRPHRYHSYPNYVMLFMNLY
jgi:hypothetical protein